MTVPNTFRNFDISVIIYKLEIIDPINQGKAYIAMNMDPHNNPISSLFHIHAEYSPYHKTTFYERENGGELVQLIITDENDGMIDTDFLVNHYTTIRQMNPKTKDFDEKVISLQDFINKQV